MDKNIAFSNLDLDLSKNYMLYISIGFANSLPIIKSFDKHNPIFICASNPSDKPKDFIALNLNEEDTYYDTLADSILKSSYITDLVNTLKTNQETVWVKMFRNHPSFQSLFDDDKVKALGLSAQDTHLLNNKISQYKLLKNVVPISNFVIANKNTATSLFDDVKSNIGVFTSLPYGGGGSGARIHKNKNSLETYLSEINDSDLIMASGLDVQGTMTMDFLIGNENEIFVYGLCDSIMDGLKAVGCEYPSKFNEKIQKDATEITYEVAKALAKKGVKGSLNVDLIVDEKENVYFCELNARYGGATGFRMLTLDSHKNNDVSISDLEMMAIKQGTFKGHKLAEPDNFFWFKKELYSETDGIINFLDINNDPVRIFNSGQGIALIGQMNQGEHVLKDKSFLGNYVSVQKTRKDLDDSVKYSSKIIEQYVAPTM